MSSVPFIPEAGTENSSFNTTIVTVAASLSFAGCFFIIVTYIWLRLTHQFHLKCIFILSIVDLCISIVFLIGTTNIGNSLEIERLRPYVCHTLDTILHFLFIASFMWTACIAHMLLRVITYEDDNLERYHVLYHLISWGVAGGIVAILVARHVWFDVACDDGRLEEYGIVRFLFFIPLVVSWFYNIYAFVKLSKKLYKERKLHLQVVKFAPETGGTSDETPGIVHTHRLFLIAFAICWIWGILLSLFGFFNVHTHIGWIQTVNYAFTPLPGLFNSIIYGMNDALKVKINDALERYKCCRNMNNDDLNETLLGERYNNEEFLRWRGGSDNHSVQ